ncbi:MAG: YolD-like family protein [Bacilli bacterium]|nr:YolD-like family protein [Bacilli bacterium]
MFDRGFVKWQPFNAVTSPAILVNEEDNNKVRPKPILFPEEQEKLGEQIIEAFYEQSKIKIYFYEYGKLKEIEAVIKKVEPSTKSLELNNGKKICFKQIIKIKEQCF